ncbi:hypothetical protein AB9P05_04600 [Roseivirga sp. BDSF3-8]|uniref:hypothetical protein n=1 Tax=Roseivirga sp. BDSF3-8 TaxID=3241598 RepID=UPI003531951C
MKNLVMLLLGVCLLTSCNDDDLESCNDEMILGTWQYSGYFFSDGSTTSGPWTPVLNGFRLTLDENEMFTSTDAGDCDEGTYRWFTNGLLVLDYYCEDFNSRSGVGEGAFFWEIDNCNLILIPDGRCFEPCYYLFSRVSY